MSEKSAKLPGELIFSQTYPMTVFHRWLHEKTYPQVGDCITDEEIAFVAESRTKSPRGWECSTDYGDKWVSETAANDMLYTIRADNGPLTFLHEMWGVYFDALPPDQIAPFSRWMYGQTCGSDPKNGKSYAYYHDYEAWYDAWVIGEEAKVYD